MYLILHGTRRYILCFLSLLIYSTNVYSQQNDINPFGLDIDYSRIEYTDLDGDNKPDVIRSFINDTIPIQWIDEDNTMEYGHLQGDMINDCLMIDRNMDGIYDGAMDLVVDWIDSNGDGKADIQIILDNAKYSDKSWGKGHVMVTIDTDKDQVFNHINWNTLQLEAWDRSGRCNFFQDYAGQTLFMKIHTSVFNLKNFSYNWENPFLFYDMDGDGLSEMAIRFIDKPVIDFSKKYSTSLSKKINDVRMTFDMDNDNSPGNEFDFDMSLKFYGKGFDFSDHVHKIENLKRFTPADSLFSDNRWRYTKELVYVDHNQAYDKTYSGDWEECWFVFDEDDDCHRWERVEFYDPRDLFKIGARNGGLDNNPQADPTGDRGEWDMDFSGEGNLYISPLDGKIHLYGAEWGGWRIDQNAEYYQGWQGWRGGADKIPHARCIMHPNVFPTIKYSDTNENGFFDTFEFDLDGDTIFELKLSATDLEINDAAKIHLTSPMNYADYTKLFKLSAEKKWLRAQNAIKAAQAHGIPTNCYAFFFHPKSLREKYHNGFWLNLYIYIDFRKFALSKNDLDLLKKVDTAYLTGNWNLKNN